MTSYITGNKIIYIVETSDIGKTVTVTLPDGYSMSKVFFVRSSNNIILIEPTMLYNTEITFPVVNSKSPNTLKIQITENASTNDSLSLLIFKFGCIPDPLYFKGAFNPILVKAKDENSDEIEYNMIPSTQFER